MILLLGGTSDSIVLAKTLCHNGFELILSTATPYGETLATQEFDGTIIQGAMDEVAMVTFCQRNQITSLIDATHPFARIASETAMAVSQLLHIEYIRYERPSSEVMNQVATNQFLHVFDTFEKACQWLNTTSGNILVTTGSKDAAFIVDHIDQRERLYFRFLPLVEQVTKMEKLGLKANQLMAMQGPFSLEMNKAMIHHISATIILTKESGLQGHVDEKIEAAKECGAMVALIRRPSLEYTTLFSDIDLLVTYMNRNSTK
jgi:precorrin-6A/cobalt-precorrin-6A reductase